jgi:DNA-binding SARP family transcriptional activator
VSDFEFRLLGPVQVLRAGALVPIGRGTALVLLTGLLSSPNRTVATDSLIEWSWPEVIPAHPRAALHNAMSRLRHLLGAGVFSTASWGYRINVDPKQLDLLRFEESVAVADRAMGQGQLEDAVAHLDNAVSLWREPVLGNIDSPVLRNAIVPRLREQYLDVVERRASLYLQLNRPGAVIKDLSAIARADPYRERIAAQLITALALTGRQGDALVVYNSLRSRLRDELGIDPGADLQNLYLKILRGGRRP